MRFQQLGKAWGGIRSRTQKPGLYKPLHPKLAAYKLDILLMKESEFPTEVKPMKHKTKQMSLFGPPDKPCHLQQEQSTDKTTVRVEGKSKI